MTYKKLTPPFHNDILDLKQTHFNFDNEGVFSRLNYKLEDICSLYNNSIESLNAKNDFLKKKISETPYPINISNDDDFRALRVNQAIDEQTDKVNSMNSFLNEVTAVYLWALIEQTENKLITLIEKEKKGNIHIGFADWKSRKKYFKELGIKVDEFKKYFEVVELQKLNNKVKHLGKVDEDLSKTKSFRGKINYPLELVTIPIKEYLSSSYLYIIDLLCSVENEIFDFPLRKGCKEKKNKK